MTGESDFQKELDAHPDDWQTLLVFSDWLRDRDDPRADGYAALAALKRYPGSNTLTRDHGRSYGHDWEGTWFGWANLGRAHYSRGPVTARDPEALPADWYELLKGDNQLPGWKADAWGYFRSCAEAFDVAARAFAQLPAPRRAEVLASEPAGT